MVRTVVVMRDSSGSFDCGLRPSLRMTKFVLRTRVRSAAPRPTLGPMVPGRG